jgi:hypothetical protein
MAVVCQLILVLCFTLKQGTSGFPGPRPDILDNAERFAFYHNVPFLPRREPSISRLEKCWGDLIMVLVLRFQLASNLSIHQLSGDKARDHTLK